VKRFLYGPALLGAALFAACSSGGTPTSTPGSIALVLNPTSGSVQQGGSTPIDATLTRGGGFTGTVNLTVTGSFTGISAVVSNVATTGTTTTATVTISVALGTTPGSYPLVVHGTGTGVTEATATYTLTVTPAGSFTLSVTPAGGVTMTQGTSDNSKTIVITRTNFAPAITLTAENLPAGLTATFTPNPTAIDASVLTLTATAALAPNTYNLTIRGTGAAALRAPDGDLASVEATTTLAVTVTPAGSFTLAVTPAGGLTMPQGTSNNTKTITINRTNYAPAITLTAENLPTGLTASFAPNPAGGNTSVLTLTAAASLTPNTYNLTIRGTGPAALRAPGGGLVSVEATTTLAVTVTAAAASNFSLSTTPSGSASVTQGAGINVTINVNRTGGNTSNVTLTVTGTLPAGLTAVPSPSSTTGTSSTLMIAAGAAVPVGDYPIVIHGNATGLPEQVANLTISVAPSGGGGSANVSVDVNGCAPPPTWAAFQNGDFTAPWQVVTPVNGVYSFSITAGRGGFTTVTLGFGGATVVSVQYLTQAQFTAGTVFLCPAAAGGRSLSGTVAGMSAGNVAQISFGNAYGAASTEAPNFTLDNAPSGLHDLIIYAFAGTGASATDRMGIWRDENPAGSFGSRDLQGPNGFAPAPATISITGGVGGESFVHSMTYYSGSTCDASPLYQSVPVTGTDFTAFGAPSSVQRSGDRHGILIQGNLGTGVRSVLETSHDLTAHSVAMPSQLPAGTTTQAGAAYSILRKQFTAPAEYNSQFAWQYTQASLPRTVSVTASYGYFAGVNVDLKIGNYSGLAGWDDSWPPAVGSLAKTQTIAVGGSPAGGFCSAGTNRYVVGSLAGSF
jgi:uncharacterized membrane protein